MTTRELPLISVIVPCYNQAHFLSEAIESVLAQSYPHFEIVVVDDGSTDNTSEVAARYSRVRLIRQENQGLAAARNTGIRRSNGSYLAFLDADDRLLPGALEVGLEHLSAYPECAFVSGHCTLTTSDGSPLCTPQQLCIEREHYLALLRGNYIWSHATVMYQRFVFETLGGFDTSLDACEDYELYFRIARKFPVYCHGSVVAEYRQHDMNMTSNSALMLESVLTVLHSQWQYVKGNKQYEEAYESGIKHYQDKYGDPPIKGVHHSWSSQAIHYTSKTFYEYSLLPNHTILEKFRPAVPTVVARPEANDGNITPKKILVLGVYLANVPTNVDDIVATLFDSIKYEVNQRWVALGGQPPTRRVADVTVDINSEKASGFKVINRLLTEEDLTQYEYVSVVADDVVLPHHFLDQFVPLQADLTFSLAQPACTSNSYIDHPIVEQQRGVTARQTLFVGTGPVLCLHNSVYDLVLPVDSTTPMGWRYENVWSCPLAEHNLKMGIIDVVPIDHSLRRPATHDDQEMAAGEREALLDKLGRFPCDEAFTVLEVIPYPGRQTEVQQR